MMQLSHEDAFGTFSRSAVTTQLTMPLTMIRIVMITMHRTLICDINHLEAIYLEVAEAVAAVLCRKSCERNTKSVTLTSELIAKPEADCIVILQR